MKTMALSGKATTLFTNNNAFELIIEWSASQNIADNSSSVTAIMKLRGVQSWSSVSDATASATSITINGNTKNFTANSTISGGQTKELGRHTVTVPHNADGTKTFNISGAHYFDIYWNGGSPITPSLSNNYTLNTIPRASTGSGTAFAFTANSPISISRASTAFTHKARFHVDGTFIKELTGLTTSGTFSFTDAERKSIVTRMANRTTVQCRVDLWTYNGSTQIGSVYQFTYNVTAPAKASGTVADFTISTAGFPVELTNFNTGAKFTYRATWMYGSMGDLVNNPTTANFTFPLTQANVNTMLAETPNSNGTWGTLRVQSFFDGVQFGGNTDIKPINAKINATVYAPDVKAGSTFKDTNATSVAVTGNNQIVVKTLSNVTVDIPAGLGTAKGGATLTKIRLALGGTTKDVDYVGTATTLTLGTTNASSNSNLNVSVIDSRGNMGTWTTPVTVVDYTSPTLSPVIERVNNYETSTEVILAGKYTRTIVGGVDKNAISTVRYRYKQTSSTVWSALANLPYTATGGNISSPPNTFINLDNTYSWNLEITATDKFNITATTTVLVPKGIPLVFFDTKLKSVGIGQLPSSNNSLEVNKIIEPRAGFQSERLPQGANLNSYTTTGFYYSPANVDVATMSNRPRNRAMAFSLLVQQHAGVNQLYTEYTQQSWYQFTRNMYNGVWGEWSLCGGDSGWLNLVPMLPSGFATYYADGSEALRARRVGNMVQVVGIITNTTAFTGFKALFVLPEIVRPADTQSFTNYGAGTNQFQIRVFKNGTFAIDRYQGGTWAVNTEIQINLMYFID